MASMAAGVRGGLRLLGVAALLAYGGMLAIGLSLLPKPRRLPLVQHWSKLGLFLLGVRVSCRGRLNVAAGSMILPNHISWLDILVFNAVLPVRFIAKAEVAAWPVIGWLSQRAGTIYIKREARSALRGLNMQLAAILLNHENIIVFAEGTTTDGAVVLPFKAAMLQAALATECPVHPAALCYHHGDGSFDPVPAYISDDTLVGSLWRIASRPGTLATVSLDPPLPVTTGCRRELASTVHSAVIRLRAEIGPIRPPA